jgi:transcriptional regulator with XRE-family HTH domain
MGKRGRNLNLLLRLSELRKKNHLSQENIADILGVARTTYAMYEQGHREMDYSTLLKIADYYKVSLDYIFDRSAIPIHPENYSDDEIEFMIKSLSLYQEIKDKYQ